MEPFNYSRRKSSVTHIGETPLGGDNPIRIQSMANVSTMDTEACVEQAIRMIEAGAEYVRFTAQGEREARNLGEIRNALQARGYTTPLIADIHFNPKAADVAAKEVEKVRVNPGNYASDPETIRERFTAFLNICKTHKTAVRIGVNHGSLSERIMNQHGDTPEGMVASCMEFLRICREENFTDVVISMKASNTVVMVKSARLLVKTMEAEDMHYPLHLGVTEAGDGEDGRIKSAVGIGALLSDGIGDTIRVSLSEEPEAEIPVARKLVDYILERKGHESIDMSVAPDYDPFIVERRLSRLTHNIGGGHVPVVISDRRQGSFEFNYASPPDYIYIGKENPDNFPDNLQLLVDAQFWKPKPNAFPYFIAPEIDELRSYDSPLKFIRLTLNDLSESVINVLSKDRQAVVILSTSHRNGTGEMRAAIHQLMKAGCDIPVVLHRDYNEVDAESLQIKSAVDFGTLLLDGFGDGIMLHNEEGDPVASDNIMFGILQASRTRISKTEYISCPGCGRTLYDLQTTVAKVKEATSHLKGLKIGIMGCIVNGPGEMADADYGYVGSGRGKIDLYKGKTCIHKNIPEAEAVERLVQLIKDNGDWKDE
ncbi:(E)-4-hydroxy-3-methylbut-2-enyl-diphosphate synthase [Parabacteroides sp. PF5-5]|uniref:4-hydroxy-3-methylbut-2-en-1-yl diphosphate synthase n=1 Tax=unclassified Parabacteroides TaxID=2649774 RepID=UPI002476F07B|nr:MULTISPECIES: 4-hydroxy-3-methylbut-2-en-1-yl diphosphate synthase [unclassified Parabacteroides]MDH6303541.1 (E)-4-hydroxy-3-methylbut-2-enyl-diphosphate synthase [Parabacteroides sp. PH5-39]MDH6314863.1 (E)-4-hydroxy-3-methylbut-2-enyl-diphosphate synthase [Parabacteroides sp. PF5-13]MDH6318200.1 (E)-4-hydroxy-3-methylbut-2-enyl-diphosphate synthase [Parabacteroides sp. PH5-13]MDH6321867.1 (E)-4-hydroxy-3-methylbut-2-enyl-diphosphate synthase [Parabacteroides sp. PH5-8]MDH6325991.1 (E)-4-